MKSYPGGKGGAGVYQKLINLIPPHDTYIEAFLGGGAIMRFKAPARRNIGVDIDPAVLSRFREVSCSIGGPEQIKLVRADAVTWLKSACTQITNTAFIYCDPPYLLPSDRQYYPFKYTPRQHEELLDHLKSLSCTIMISGYYSELYAQKLKDWNQITFETMTRGGRKATEWVWMNYPEPTVLHEYSFLGDTFRERERIKRKKDRWQKKISSMPRLERQALLAALNDVPL